MKTLGAGLGTQAAAAGRVNHTAAATERPSVGGSRRGPFVRWPRSSDTVLAVVVFVTALFCVEGPNDTLVIRSLADVPAGEFFVIAIASGALIWRRRWSLAVLPVTLVATLLAADAFSYSEVIGLTFLVALYSVGRYVTDDRWCFIGLAAALAGLSVGSLIDESTANDLGSLLFAFLFASVIWFIGRQIRFRGERAAQLGREQAAEARRAMTEERARIARELHDVVAHRVSLMTVQAGAARTVAADDPEGALRAMEAVERAGRQVLGELRHLLGVLRPDAEVDEPGPQPGLADLPRLVDQFKETGLDVSLTMDVVQTELPARVDLSAYRIVQEALTNVLKHAGPNTQTDVRLIADNTWITIEVLDNGRGATTLPASGHGILGMRERALLLGGSLDAGPRPGGGFRVVAHLPVGAQPA
jgi:signal transduction histidine kinase